MSKSILYLCPSFPYPADSGGKVVFVNHINFLMSNGFKVHAVFFDVDGNSTAQQRKSLNNHGFESCKVFSRQVPRVNNLKTLLISLFYFIFYEGPRAFIARYNSKLQQYVSNLIKDHQFDFILFDHFTAFAFINDSGLLEKLNTGYIAHNVESKVLADQYGVGRNYLKRLFYYVEYIKTKKIEKKILQNATFTITISSEDKRILEKDFAVRKVITNIPEILPLRNKLWQYKATKNILFVGGTDYYPNYEAVSWMVNTLMPELLKVENTIVCTIVGNSDNFAKDTLHPNILFTGRINNDELEQVYRSANLFISPVTLGSGIKVKVLTALSYAMPILCTKESMHGIDYIENQDQLVFDRNLLNQVVIQIIKLLGNENYQTQMSTQIEENMESSLSAIKNKWALNNV